ncbi:MAG: hypothetical protein J5382_10285 [Bacteroidales bacterium]|nr:hypothetical protein [Bacteroidales bacterium]
MADYQLNQPGPTIQQAIDIALQTQSLLSQEATARINGDNQRATIAQLEAETARAQAAEAQCATTAQVTAETNRATGAEGSLQTLIEAIRALIPIAATNANQLADKNFVNSSIQSNTTSLITNNGNPFGSVSQLRQVTANEGDYAYVTVAAAGGTYYDRYKYTDGRWALEYRVNSTVFTANQWAAINSGITAALTQKVVTLPDAFTAITTEEINTICV